ncbi:WD40/YVTN/BNR-like repeat-containing protein [Micromonospora sp. PTRAS2]
MTRRFGRRMVALLLAPLLTGCSIGDVRRPPPDRTAPSPRPTVIEPSPSPPAPAVELRDVRVPVGKGYERPYVEFVTAEQAYALFASCPAERDCPAVLYATVDGGRSWRRLVLPRVVAENPQLYAVPGVLMLLAEPHGRYTSTDGGRTFAHTNGDQEPVAWRAAQGRFQIDYPTGRVVRWAGLRATPLPAKPPVPAPHGVVEARGLLVVAGVDGGKPYAAVSTDRGRTWQPTPVPAPDGEVGVVRPMVGPDGEARLVGWPPDRSGFPALWRYLGRWVAVPAAGHPARADSVVPLTTGRFAVNGPDGAGVVADGRYDRLDWPVAPKHYLTLLADGTLVGRAPDEVLLATGPVGNRRWVRVVLAPA